MNAVLDGEIIVAGENGISNFGNLQTGEARPIGSCCIMCLTCFGITGIH